jgi:hypothetical protein
MYRPAAVAAHIRCVDDAICIAFDPIRGAANRCSRDVGGPHSANRRSLLEGHTEHVEEAHDQTKDRGNDRRDTTERFEENRIR